MDVKAYIESGILDLYVMDALSPAESREVERLAELYPEIRAEIGAIQSAMTAYAEDHALAPRRDLKAEILAKAQVQSAPGKTSSARNGLLWLLGGVIILGLLGFLYLSSRCRAAEERLRAESERRVLALEAEADSLRKANAGFQRQIDVLTNPGTKTVPLNGLPIARNSRATIYWNEAQGSTLLVVGQLPQAEPGKQYQLWALKDNKPIDAGVFDVDTTRVQVMKTIADADAFAVTLEKAGGSASPSLDQMYLQGPVQ